MKTYWLVQVELKSLQSFVKATLDYIKTKPAEEYLEARLPELKLYEKCAGSLGYVGLSYIADAQAGAKQMVTEFNKILPKASEMWLENPPSEIQHNAFAVEFTQEGEEIDVVVDQPTGNFIWG